MSAHSRAMRARRRFWTVVLGVLAAASLWVSPAVAEDLGARWDADVIHGAVTPSTTAVALGHAIEAGLVEHQPRWRVVRSGPGCLVEGTGVDARCDSTVQVTTRPDGGFMVRVTYRDDDFTWTSKR